jgi:nitrogen fixation-related uncharacterized protein
MHSGQFDDLETPPRRILYDDVAAGQPGRKEAVSFNEMLDTPVSDRKSE